MLTTPLIQLPNQFYGARVSHIITEVEAHSPDGLPSQICFDFGTLGFVRPVGVVILSNLVHWLASKGTKVLFRNIDRPTQALRFLDDSLFFKQHTGKVVNAGAAPRSTTRPLIQITRDRSHEWLETDLLPWLSSKLSLSVASFGALKTSISEIFNNIKDHTTMDIGSIFVQFFPNEKRINIAVSDFGAGIPSSVAKVQSGLTDHEAIRLAMTEGFTTRSIPTNQGIGLDYLLRTAVLTNGGYVTVYSRSGIVEFHRSGDKIEPRDTAHVGFIPGTTIDICLRTDTIEAIQDSLEDLEW